jgi:hypothetical protein
MLQPPKSKLGKLALGATAIGGAAWVGAIVNSRRVARTAPAGASAAAAVGTVAGGVLATFGGALLSLQGGGWGSVGTATAVLGTGLFAAMALAGIGVSDAAIAKMAATAPKSLQLGEGDSGGTFPMSVGDSLTVQLPAGSNGSVWDWSQSPLDGLEGPSQTTQTVSGGTAEFDTFTATQTGTFTLSATLTPTGTNTSTTAAATPTTWTGTAVVT